MKSILIIAITMTLMAFYPVFAESEGQSQTLPTDGGTLEVKLSHGEIVLGELTTLRTDFINPQTRKIQEHIDWSLTISKDDQVIWGPTSLSHTSVGSLENLKYKFEDDGKYTLEFGIEGILFQPIPPEKVSFEVYVEDAQDLGIPLEIPDWINNTMQWYHDGLISENELITAIQFLVTEGIVKVSQ